VCVCVCVCVCERERETVRASVPSGRGGKRLIYKKIYFKIQKFWLKFY